MTTAGWVFVYLLVVFSGVLGDEAAEIFSKASCDFAIDLLKAQMKQTEGNVVLSPNSIGLVLAALQQGTKENTLKQLESALHLTAEQSRLGHYNALKTLQREKSNVTLEWGNRAYVKPGFELLEGFNTTIRENFGADIQELNFIEPSTEEAANVINSWVKDVTHDHITNLVTPEQLSHETVLVLLNAIYFKGLWDKPFPTLVTVKDVFYKSPDVEVTVTYMNQLETHFAGEDLDLGFKWVNLLFEDDQFSMLLLLPHERYGLQKVFENLNGEVLQRIINDGRTIEVTLQVPKFKLQEKIELENTLKELGLTEMFTEDANLQGITTKTKLSVSSVVHQANVEIDEEGTTAAAATGLFVGVPTSYIVRDNLMFTADHPFLFFILDRKNKVPLFAGKIVDPS